MATQVKRLSNSLVRFTLTFLSLRYGRRLHVSCHVHIGRTTRRYGVDCDLSCLHNATLCSTVGEATAPIYRVAEPAEGGGVMGGTGPEPDRDVVDRKRSECDRRPAPTPRPAGGARSYSAGRVTNG